MKQHPFYFALFITTCLTSCSQSNISTYNGKKWEEISGSGKLVTLNPTVGAFTNIALTNMNVKVNVVTGSSQHQLSVAIDDNLSRFFRLKQEGRTLQLSMDYSGGKYDRWVSGNNTVVTINAPAVKKFTNTGNSVIEINLQRQSNFELVSNGNANIKLLGTIETLKLRSSGNADINAAKLNAAKVELEVNGNSDIIVNTKELVKTSVNGNNTVENLFYLTKKEMANSETYTNWASASKVNFLLKNNSILPVKVTLISYKPNEKGNGTTGFMMAPYGRRSLTFIEGTKIYLANSDQVNTVMSGAKISNQPPFLIVKKEDEGREFKISN